MPHERGGGWWRRTTAASLVVLACIVLVASVVGLWARRNFLDTPRFVDRAGPLIEEPAVQGALATRLTEQLMIVIDPKALFEEVLPDRGQILAVPLANAVEGFVRDRVETFIATDRFERLWVGALELAHTAAVRVLRDESDAVTTGDGEVTLNLLPVINAVLADITAQSPEILGRQVDLPDVTVDEIPKDAITALENALGVTLDDDFGQFTVYDDGKLAAAQDAVSLFDRFVVVLLPLGVVLVAAALWISHRRRRTLLQVCFGLAVGMVLIRRVGFRLQDEVAALPPRSQGKEAARLAAESFVHPLTTFGAWVFVGAAIVAVDSGAHRQLSLGRVAAAPRRRAVDPGGRDDRGTRPRRGHGRLDHDPPRPPARRGRSRGAGDPVVRRPVVARTAARRRRDGGVRRRRLPHRHATGAPGLAAADAAASSRGGRLARRLIGRAGEGSRHSPSPGDGRTGARDHPDGGGRLRLGRRGSAHEPRAGGRSDGHHPHPGPSARSSLDVACGAESPSRACIAANNRGGPV